MPASATAKRVASRVTNEVLSLMPPRLAGTIDLYRPALRDSWGGPLNGQRHRQAMFREITRLVPVDVMVETGTFRGTTSEFLVHLTGKPLKTVESHPRFHHYSQRRLRSNSLIDISLEDSRSCLRKLAANSDLTSKTTLFYLDAHWNADLPLAEEIEIIAAAWKRAIIIIDDFEVPGDPGYGFDDYGPGRVLSEECLPEKALTDWEYLYPSLPSIEETGARRGSIVLVSPLLSGLLREADTVREAVKSR